MTKIALNGFAAIAVLALGACTTSDAELAQRIQPVEVRHPIVVEPHIREMRIASNPAGLSEEDRASIRSAAREYLTGGHGKITLATPDGSGGKRAAVKTLSDTMAVMENAGVPRNRIEVASYAGGAGGDAVLVSYMTYTATGPDCGDFSEDISHSPDNQPTLNFGCASQRNLAAMVEDPRDLIAPRGEEPASSARRATVLKAYREGQVTAATRNDQDSGAVSTVGR